MSNAKLTKLQTIYRGFKNHYGRYIKSSIVTFIAGICLMLVANWDMITLEAFKDGSILGVIFIAVRGGFKLVVELFLAWYNTRKK